MNLSRFSHMGRFGIVGAVAAVCFLLWLVPMVVGLIFSFVWFVVKLPFRLLHLIVFDGIGGLLLWLWGLFKGFFALFGWLGRILMWGVLGAGAFFGAMFVVHYLGAGKGRAEKAESGPPRFYSRAWALSVLGLEKLASKRAVLRRYNELTQNETDAARLERLRQAYDILSR